MLSPCRNVSRLVTDTASRHPERTAIVFGDDHFTYADLDAAADRVAKLLVSRGIQPGDRVALSCPNRGRPCAVGQERGCSQWASSSPSTRPAMAAKYVCMNGCETCASRWAPEDQRS